MEEGSRAPWVEERLELGQVVPWVPNAWSPANECGKKHQQCCYECCEVKVKLKIAAGESEWQRRHIMHWTFDVLAIKMCTTASLSEQKRTCHRNHWEPHTWEGTTTGEKEAEPKWYKDHYRLSSSHPPSSSYSKAKNPYRESLFAG